MIKKLLLKSSIFSAKYSPEGYVFFLNLRKFNLRITLLMVLLFTVSIVFSQNTESVNITTKVQLPQGKTISNVSAFPNPSNNKTLVSFDSTLEQTVFFEVKNVLGKSVYKQKHIVISGLNEISFQKENLTAGMYIYSIQTDTEIVSKRLVIK